MKLNRTDAFVVILAAVVVTCLWGAVYLTATTADKLQPGAAPVTDCRIVRFKNQIINLDHITDVTYEEHGAALGDPAKLILALDIRDDDHRYVVITFQGNDADALWDYLKQHWVTDHVESRKGVQ
jgi:hypothetical protein